MRNETQELLPVAKNRRSPAGGTGVVVRDDPRSPAAEAFRMIRTNMEFMSAGGSSGLWLFTSGVASEGKSTVVANLGYSLAATGRKTLIIDGDMRRPSQHQLFQLEKSPGLSHILTGNKSLTDCIHPVDSNLDLVPSGIVPPNPAELWQDPIAGTILQQAAELYDTVLVDSPPILMVTDAQLIARHCQRVVLVVRSGFTRKDALKEACQLLERSGAHVSVVLNRVRAEVKYAYYAYYQ